VATALGFQLRSGLLGFMDYEQLLNDNNYYSSKFFVYEIPNLIFLKQKILKSFSLWIRNL
jgi:hypothetical protein